eukprot:139177-Chlamydomonas_euryale.AAC.1
MCCMTIAGPSWARMGCAPAARTDATCAAAIAIWRRERTPTREMASCSCAGVGCGSLGLGQMRSNSAVMRNTAAPCSASGSTGQL